jgi:hypothetical protein
MSKWSDVIEAQRRWADRIAQADGRFHDCAPRQPSPLLRTYFRVLSAIGKGLVSLGLRLQNRYRPGPGNGGSPLPVGR